MPRALRNLAVVALLTFGFTAPAFAGELVEVFIDARDPAYVVVQGVESNTPQEAWTEMEGYAQLPNVQLMAWLTFRKNARAILAPFVIRDDYPKAQTLMGVLALVKKYPGRPFAVTWNGGVAVSFWDYQHAAQTFQRFHDDPAGYTVLPPNDDPVHPLHQFPPLLNR